MDRIKLVVVCGPTATGKSALAVRLAQRFGGEMISADSMQVYRGLAIGTAALTKAQAGGVPQHLAGFLPPERPFSVADWLRRARRAVAQIAQKGALPVVCGGTGLYVSSLVKGITFTEEEPDGELRRRLLAEWEAQGGEAMLARLAERDPERAARLHPKDKTRVLRALQQSLATGATARQREAASRPARPPYQTLLLGLHYADRADLYGAIERRVDEMMRAGLPREAEEVWRNRLRYQTAAQAIGYKELFPYFAGEATLDECTRRLKTATRRYAKRQITWFKSLEGICWLRADDQNAARQAEALCGDFLREGPPG